jgi:O-antigen/teichoic acid export membrane protein
MNDEEKNPEQEISVEKSSKHITRGVIANFLFNYGTLPINLIITYFVVRNLTPESGFYRIFTNTLVFGGLGAQLWLLFFPPSIGSVLVINVPKLMYNKEFSKIRGIVRYALTIKILAATIVSMIYAGIGISLIFTADNPINGIALLIFSPYLIFEEIRKIFFHLFQGMKKFMIRFYLFFTQKVLLLIGYLIIFYAFELPTDIILYIVLVWNIVVLFPSIGIYIFLYIKRFKKYPRIPITWKDILSSAKHGIYFTIIAGIQSLSNQINYGILNTTKIENERDHVAEFNLANNLVTQSFGAFNMPLTPILVDFYTVNKQKEMMRLFKKSTYFINILLAFITGLVFYLSKIYVLVVYTPEFMKFVPLLRIFVFIIYFENWMSNYQSLYSATYLHKRMVVIRAINFGFSLLIAVISFLIFNFEGFLIAYIIGRISTTFMYWIDTKFILKKYAITLWDIVQQFIIMTLILLANFALYQIIDLIPMDWLLNLIGRILNFLPFDIHNQAAILVEEGIQIFTFIIFYSIYVVFFRAITQNDIKMLENAKLRVPFKKILRKILRKRRENVLILPV